MSTFPKPTPPPPSRSRFPRAAHRLWALAKPAIAVLLVVWLVRSGHFDLKILAGALAHPLWLGAAALAMTATVLVSAVRWRLLMAVQGIVLARGETLRLSLIGMFFSTILPGGISGDAVKVYYVAEKYPDRKTATVFTILMDRVLGLASLMVLALAAVGLRWSRFSGDARMLSITAVLALIVGGLLVALPLALSSGIRRSAWVQGLLGKLPFSAKVNQLYDSVQAIKTRPAPFQKALAASALSALFLSLSFFLFGKALGNTINTFADYSIVVPLIFIAVVIPIAPAGIGVGQAAALLFFSMAGISGDGLGAGIMTLYQVGLILFAVCGAVIFLTHKKEMAKAVEQSKQEAHGAA